MWHVSARVVRKTIIHSFMCWLKLVDVAGAIGVVC